MISLPRGAAMIREGLAPQVGLEPTWLQDNRQVVL
jgi:hypothetical protein